MLERIANSRTFVSFVLATFTGALLLRFYPFPDSNLYLQYIAIRDPLIYGILSGSYTLFLFTTPFFVYSAALSGIYVFSFARKRKNKRNSLRLTPTQNRETICSWLLEKFITPRRSCQPATRNG